MELSSPQPLTNSSSMNRCRSISDVSARQRTHRGLRPSVLYQPLPNTSGVPTVLNSRLEHSEATSSSSSHISNTDSLKVPLLKNFPKQKNEVADDWKRIDRDSISRQSHLAHEIKNRKMSSTNSIQKSIPEGLSVSANRVSSSEMNRNEVLILSKTVNHHSKVSNRPMDFGRGNVKLSAGTQTASESSRRVGDVEKKKINKKVENHGDKNPAVDLMDRINKSKNNFEVSDAPPLKTSCLLPKTETETETETEDKKNKLRRLATRLHNFYRSSKTEYLVWSEACQIINQKISSEKSQFQFSDDLNGWRKSQREKIRLISNVQMAGQKKKGFETSLSPADRILKIVKLFVEKNSELKNIK